MRALVALAAGAFAALATPPTDLTPTAFVGFAVFALVLLWDFLAPRLQIRRELRAARLRAARERKPASAAVELSR